MAWKPRVGSRGQRSDYPVWGGKTAVFAIF